jgi:putative membrane protein insertion efficiency factor
VVNSHQSAAQSDGGPLPGSQTGSAPSISPLQWVVIAALRIYKLCISPWLPSNCRFYPTCSEYMLQAVQKYGALRGIWMGIQRLAKCHPFHAGGVDPVR